MTRCKTQILAVIAGFTMMIFAASPTVASFSLTVVPEPASLALLGLGGVLVMPYRKSMGVR
ncbi:MAG: PEP-CTERM sorting domain-containing protein [Phycisphaera sp.]|nr:PEP-CTERM sorting domain-containing protein [Phycisphaera sp.]